MLHARGRRGNGAGKDSGDEVEMVRGKGEEEREWLLWEVGQQMRIEARVLIWERGGR